MESNVLIDLLEQEHASLPTNEGEIVQHLIELGYLPQLNLEVLNRVQVQEAEDHFLSDLNRSGLNSEGGFMRGFMLDQSALLLEYTRKATDIDEGYTFNQLPELGETNLISCIIHYRLELFGLWDEPVNKPYGKATAIALDQLARYADFDRLSAINALADIEGFTKHLINTRPAEDFILTFKGRNLSKKYKKRAARKFLSQLRKDLKPDNAFLTAFTNKVVDVKGKKADYGFLARESRDDFKHFVLRLIQVHQWQEGLYEGILDGKIGNLSLASLTNAIAFDQANIRKKNRLNDHELLAFLGNDFCMLNGYYFLTRYMLEPGENTDEAFLWQQMNEQVAAASSTDQSDYQLQVEQVKKRIKSDAEQAKVKKGFFKRIYCGVKKMIKKARVMLKKLVSDLGAMIKRAWDFVKKLFKAFFENLKMAIRAFVDGIKFLFGKKEIVSTKGDGFSFSKFQITGDCLNVVQNPSHELIQQHRGTTAYNFKVMGFSLKVVSGVLKIVINAASVIGWPLLLINLVKVFKSLTEEYHKLKQSIISINQAYVI